MVLAGACVRSLPQILRIVRAKAATGVSLTSNIAELLAYSITIAYNFRQGEPQLMLCSARAQRLRSGAVRWCHVSLKSHDFAWPCSSICSLECLNRRGFDLFIPVLFEVGLVSGFDCGSNASDET